MQASPTVDRIEQQSLFTVRHAWMLTAALIFSGLLTQVKGLPGGFERNDFAHYYLAARILLRGENPYTVPLKPLCEEYGFEYDERIPYGANPPLLIRAFTLLAWMPPRIAFAVWMTLEFSLLCLLLECTRRIVDWRANQVTWWLFLGFVLSSTSLQAHMHYSQVQLLVAAVLAVAFAARLQGKHWIACGLVALAAGFKIYPAVLLPWFVLWGVESNKERIYRAGIVAGVLVLILAVTGPAAWISFVRDGLSVIQSNATVSSHTNYSLQALLVNALDGTLSLFGVEQSGKIAAAAARLVSPIVIAATYLLIWRRQLSNVAAFCLLMVMMILASPVAWSHYMIMMTLPAAILFRTGATIENNHLRHLIYIVAGLSLMPDLDGSFFDRSESAFAWAIHYYPLYALLVAAVLFVRLREFPLGKRNEGSGRRNPAREKALSVA
jgi:hypothetical protein